MKRIRKNNKFKLLWIVLAIHILNFSFDAPDAQQFGVAEDLSYNEIESISEYFTENILHIKDAFKECDEQNEDESGFVKKTIEVFFYKNINISESKIVFLKIKNNCTNVHYYEPFCANNYLPIFSPPPES